MNIEQTLIDHKLWLQSGGKKGARANLRDADLGGAYLRGANLRGANLRGANLSDANLCDANLVDANLCDANLSDANLRGANLSDANLCGANLVDANLCDANLSDANLCGANLVDANLCDANLSDANHELEVPVIEDIHKKVYDVASKPGALDMNDWHTCETTHCRAGWVVTLAGKEGLDLESKTSCAVAASLIYMKSDPKLKRIPDFYCRNEEALEDMKKLAGVA